MENKINLSGFEGIYTANEAKEVAIKIGEQIPVKLTKSALNKFIGWTTSRYNDYLGYGTKKQNVELVFKALNEGNYKGQKIFDIQCASPVGENGNYKKGFKAWGTKQAGDDYIIDCESMTITAKYSKRSITFFKK